MASITWTPIASPTSMRLGSAGFTRMPTGASRPAGRVMSFRSWDNTKHINPTPYLDPASSGDPTSYMISANAYTNKTAAQLGRKTGGTLRGNFMVNSVPKAGARIVVLERRTGRYIRSVLTDADGNYSFPYLNLDVNAYVVVGIDPTDTERAEAYDRVFPL